MNVLALCILALSIVPLSSAAVDLSGLSGRDALSSIESGSGLWNWGSAPLGHVVEDSQLLSEVRKNPGDISIMETPLQAQGLDSGGMIGPIVSGFSDASTGISNIQTPHQTSPENKGLDLTVFSGYGDMQPLDKTATGVFDCICFKAPTVAQFPRVY